MEESRRLEPGGQFVLDADAGSVELVGTAKSGARIVITSKDDKLAENFDIKIEESAGMVKVTAKKKGSGWLSWGNVQAPNFKIEVPTSTALQIETGGGHLEIASIRGPADLRTSGGHIGVESLEGKLVAATSGGHISLKGITGDSSVETSGGHIEAEKLTGALECRTSGGHIEVHGVTGDLKASTSGGHIEISGAGGRVVAKTSGGAIEAAFVRGNAKGGSLESSGGGISVVLDPAVDLTIDAETSGGRVRSDLPLKVQGEISGDSLRGALGKGGELLRLRTSAGSIRIGAAGPA